jgi:hypothetical protein
MGSHIALSADRLLLPAKVKDTEPEHLYEFEWQSGMARALTHDSAQYDGLSEAFDHKSTVAIQSITESSLWLLEKSKTVRLTPPNGRYLGVTWIGQGRLVAAGEINGRNKLWKIFTSGRKDRFRFQPRRQLSPLEHD